MLKTINITNFLEQRVAKALYEKGVHYLHESQGHKQDGGYQTLDFYLPESNTYIEVKQYYSDRTEGQLYHHENVIVLQGQPSVDLFCKLINGNREI